jgi:phage/conjugal plasmid C-4 type zinc finger TraR family protein
MGDEVDDAQAREELHRQKALAQWAKASRPPGGTGESALPTRRSPRLSRDCGDCGNEIAKARLRAVPEATRCTPCQAAFERGVTR